MGLMARQIVVLFDRQVTAEYGNMRNTTPWPSWNCPQITQIDADTEQKNSSSAFICVNLRANALSSSLVHSVLRKTPLRLRALAPLR
jgi:hypothetical protein